MDRHKKTPERPGTGVFENVIHLEMNHMAKNTAAAAKVHPEVNDQPTLNALDQVEAARDTVTLAHEFMSNLSALLRSIRASDDQQHVRRLASLGQTYADDYEGLLGAHVSDLEGILKGGVAA